MNIVNMNIVTKCCLTNTEEVLPWLPTGLGRNEGLVIHQLTDLGQDPELPNWGSASTSVLLSILLWQQSQDPDLCLRGGKSLLPAAGPCLRRVRSHHCSPAQSAYFQSSLSRFWVLRLDTLVDPLGVPTCNTVSWESKFFQYLSSFQKQKLVKAEKQLWTFRV